MYPINPYDGKTERLIEARDKLLAERAELDAKLEELEGELSQRSNVQGTIENHVIDGKHEVLRQAGVPVAVLDEAVRRVTERREEKIAARAEREAAEAEVES